MTVSTFFPADSNSQTVADYSPTVDGDISVFTRLGDMFAPHEQASPNMTIALDPGHVFDGATLTEVATQNTSTITAPVTNPRIDRVVIDQFTGVVSVVTGTEASSPTLPAVPAGTRASAPKLISIQ